MLKISNSDITTQTLLVEDAYTKGLTSPLYFDKFISKLSDTQKVSEKFTPYEVRVGKPIHRLLQRDYEPARIIRVDEPIYDLDGIRCWYGSTLKGITFRGLGYRNGDSRYPGDVGLNDTTPHGYLAGITGHGKSVTINSVLIDLMQHYPPWELQLLMSDAKVTEFKKYTLGYVPPHIRTIAATTDSDYIISMFDSVYAEMLSLNGALGASGYNDIETFRKKTGLTIPRTLIISDEVQAMLLEAGKKLDHIKSRISQITKLGRNTGYHLMLASQEVDSNLKSLLPNITFRASLGANPQTSMEILGNDEAKINFGKKGRAIVNLNNANANKLDNIHFRVPFIEADHFFRLKETLAELGQRFDFVYPLSFYDGDSYLEEDAYKEMIRQHGVNANKIVLGEPSFIMPPGSPDPYLCIRYNSEDRENILVYGANPTAVGRISKMLRYNLDIPLESGEIYSNVLSASKPLTDLIDFGDKHNVLSCRDFNQQEMTQYLEGIFIRKLWVEADALAFSGIQPSEEGIDLTNEIFSDTPEKITPLTRARVTALWNLVSGKDYLSRLHIDHTNLRSNIKEADSIFERKMLIYTAINRYHESGCADRQFIISDLKPMYIWILAADNMIGLGLDPNANNIDYLKSCLQNSYAANVRFIITIREVEPEIKKLTSGIRYTLMEGLTADEASKMKVEGYPGAVGKVLSVFYDTGADKKECLKFKKMAFTGEQLLAN